VMHVLYLVFNEGYVATSGPTAARTDLTAEAIRLTRLLHRLVPAAEVAGLLALMLLVDARRPARTTADGSLVPLDEQDRTRWDAADPAAPPAGARCRGGGAARPDAAGRRPRAGRGHWGRFGGAAGRAGPHPRGRGAGRRGRRAQLGDARHGPGRSATPSATSAA